MAAERFFSNPIGAPFIGTETFRFLQYWGTSETPPEFDNANQYFVSLPFHLILPIVLRLANFKHGRTLVGICSIIVHLVLTVILPWSGNLSQVMEFPEAENGQILVLWLAQTVASLLFSLIVFNAVDDATLRKTVSSLVVCPLFALKVFFQPELNNRLFSITTDSSLDFYNFSDMAVDSFRCAIEVNYCFDIMSRRTQGSVHVTAYSCALLVKNIYSYRTPFTVLDTILQLACIILFIVQYLELGFIAIEQEQWNVHEQPINDNVLQRIVNGEEDKDFAQIPVEQVGCNQEPCFVSGLHLIPIKSLRAEPRTLYKTSHVDVEHSLPSAIRPFQ